MSLLLGPMKQYVAGFKELTDQCELLEIKDVPLIYLPLANGGSSQVELLVEVGDKVKVGTKVAVRNDNFTVPLFSSVSGEVVAIEQLLHCSRKRVKHLVIQNDFKYETEQAVKPLDVSKATREELIKLTEDAGIVGCGGAGFPTYFKYKVAKDIDSVLINAVECEPFITADYKEVCHDQEHLVIGLKAMLKMSQAKQMKVAIKKDRRALIAELNELFKAIPEIEVVAVPNQYPMGWERTLVYEVFKKRYNDLPSEVGVIVNNVTTAIQLGKALTSGIPIVEKVVTFSGDGLVKPENVLVPVGTKVKDIVAKLSGYRSENVVLIAGGPMMGFSMPNEDFVITPYSNAITVMESKPRESLACLRCGKCSDYCPAGLQPVRIMQWSDKGDLKALAKLRPQECIECGMCSFVCPSRLEVTEAVRQAKRKVA